MTKQRTRRRLEVQRRVGNTAETHTRKLKTTTFKITGNRPLTLTKTKNNRDNTNTMHKGKSN